MQAFFQHVGEQNSERDFPRTLVTAERHLLRFQFSQLRRFLKLPSDEMAALEAATQRLTPGGFQIWGVPEGAKAILKQVAEGDAFLLLRTWGEEGRFGFAGKVIGIPRCNASEASTYFWGEPRFPLLLLLDGSPSDLAWRDFRSALDYAPNWDPRGQTYRIKQERLAPSRYMTAQGLLAAATLGYEELSEAGSDPEIAAEILASELPEGTPEGRKGMRLHLARERNAGLVAAFKARLKEFRCSVCHFDFAQRYGELGRGYIEAHHTRPVGMMEDGEFTQLSSLIPVCANCHRMLHRRWPPLSVDQVVTAIEDAGSSIDAGFVLNGQTKFGSSQ